MNGLQVSKPPRADAFVVFGATGDLAYRKIFPAFQAMVQKGTLDMPIVAVSRGNFDLDQLRDRVHKSLQESGKFDAAAFEKISKNLHSVCGDYDNPQTYLSLREALGNSRNAVFYLAIPPSMFGKVATGLARSQCIKGARLVVEKPFGRNLSSAIELNNTLHEFFPEPSIFRIDHFLGKEPVQNLIYFHLANQLVGGSFHRNYVDNVQITMAETLGMEGRGKFYEEVGAVRDVVQNHMLQLIACLAMECPANQSNEASRDESVRVLKALRRLGPDDIVRGQYKGYRDEDGVSPTSEAETFAALRLWIDNERWEGVPFFLRTGKRMPVSATEILVRFKRPLWTRIIENEKPHSGDYLRLRISPDVVLAQGMRVKSPGTIMRGETIELVANHEPASEMLPYERLFNDAIEGETELFAREDMIMAQWAALDGILGNTVPLHFYEPGTWGPPESQRIFTSDFVWHNPLPTTRTRRSNDVPKGVDSDVTAASANEART